MFQIPQTHELKGKKILLRSPLAKDYPFLREILNDEKTMEALIPFFKVTTWTEKMVESRYEQFLEEQSLGKTLTYVAIDMKSKKIVGNCGFKNIDFTSQEAAFGIILHKSFWGKGLSGECHLLCLSYGFEELKLAQVYFETDDRNFRMKGFFDKVGIPAVRDSSKNLIRYELSQKDWPKVKIRLQRSSD
jgi:ribosomal-protein-alanine N-acetyltransferase